jgi:hypothetical protein
MIQGDEELMDDVDHALELLVESGRVVRFTNDEGQVVYRLAELIEN